jgi:hypothetical protein
MAAVDQGEHARSKTRTRGDRHVISGLQGHTGPRRRVVTDGREKAGIDPRLA